MIAGVFTAVVDGAARPLAEETPIALVFNGSTEAVMMASPADLDDFGRGFALSEGIVGARDEVESVDILAHDGGVEVRMRIPDRRAQGLIHRRRRAFGPVGCGLCGIESLTQALRELPVLEPVSGVFSLSALQGAFGQLRAHQPLHDATRAGHCAALCDADGRILLAREDVGRHNALDKLIGAQALCGQAVLMTSRVSVDLVQKCAFAGVAVLMSASAPTAQAVRSAQDCGLTLVQNHPGGAIVFTHSKRFAGETA